MKIVSKVAQGLKIKVTKFGEIIVKNVEGGLKAPPPGLLRVKVIKNHTLFGKFKNP